MTKYGFGELTAAQKAMWDHELNEFVRDTGRPSLLTRVFKQMDIEQEKQYTPPPVVGYRTLSQTEVDLMNRIKGHEAATMALVREVVEHVNTQNARVSLDEKSSMGDAGREIKRFTNAEPMRWASIARTDFQTGYMALVRAVAQPVTP